MKERIRKRTKYLTVSAMLSAVGVLILSIGSFVDALDISVSALASLLCVYAVIEMGGPFPWLVWLVTSILSLVLLPQKSPVIFYALFLGFYPIIKEKAEKCRLAVSILIKLVTFHIGIGVNVLALKLFFPSQLDMGRFWWMPIALYGLCAVCFVLYDFMLTRMITLYLFKFRKRFRIK